eukprot:CAMPEP_0170211428 /NCGR_PEP_ID=MMETSP0116_2-20130129/5330_1 /TAXON_ID=400756 /ORGANISM="Durinskia baltica, Strain CSIRO CS-38" /LENGTH=237 /DNA_ID=CAMNT_0010461963 /DNA_START=94 /DNA_END=807 /DNA_ORIENTATION=+
MRIAISGAACIARRSEQVLRRTGPSTRDLDQSRLRRPVPQKAHAPQNTLEIMAHAAGAQASRKVLLSKTNFGRALKARTSAPSHADPTGTSAVDCTLLATATPIQQQRTVPVFSQAALALDQDRGDHFTATRAFRQTADDLRAKTMASKLHQSPMAMQQLINECAVTSHMVACQCLQQDLRAEPVTGQALGVRGHCRHDLRFLPCETIRQYRHGDVEPIPMATELGRACRQNFLYEL